MISSCARFSPSGKALIENISGGGGEGEKAKPFSDVSNTLASTSNPPTPMPSGSKNMQKDRRISFAQPLSPIPKRNSGSQGVSYAAIH